MKKKQKVSAGTKQILFSKSVPGVSQVVAVGRGFKTVNGVKTNIPAIICSVDRKLPLEMLGVANIIPQEVDGMPTDVVAVGEIKALSYTERYDRPVPCGVSGGVESITAGTLGCCVYVGDKLYILSNWHVFCNGDPIGSKILQPGSYDTGKAPQDVIGELAKFVPIYFQGDNPPPDPPSDCSISGAVTTMLNWLARRLGSQTRWLPPARPNISTTNLVDAALARPLEPGMVIPDILDIGYPTGIGEAELGMSVHKTGRTSEHTEGVVTQVDVTVQVSYGTKIAVFEDQLMAGAMSQGGDSGSAVLDASNKIVGLLFAGSANTTVINRIQNVVSLLDIAGVTRM